MAKTGGGQIAGMINDSETERLSWITQVDPTYNHTYPHTTEAEGNLNTDKEQRDRLSRDWSDMAISQGMPAAIRS